MAKTGIVAIAAIVKNDQLYPRNGVDRTRVRRMVAALEGGAEFPPLLCDRATLTLVDGFHRLEAYTRHLGEEARVEVELRTFRDEGAMLLASLEVNARHGLPLEPLDEARAVLLGESLGVAPERMAKALGVQPIYLETLTAERVVSGPDGPMLAKRTLAPLIRRRGGLRLSARQAKVNSALIGMRPEYYLNRVLELVEHNLLDFGNPQIAATLLAIAAAIGKRKAALRKRAA